ncbi:hypothetical protein DAI22_04g079966 [Oryza sativa Japonica Group]|nr:hypothetical protein DAI22_04g079966 [Oryza sativa Japonica Group]
MLQWPLNPAKLVVPLVLQAPAMDNIYTSRKPLHVPLNISFWVHALYACYAKPNVCECDPYAAKLMKTRCSIFRRYWSSITYFILTSEKHPKEVNE